MDVTIAEKMLKFPLQRIKTELDYISVRVKKTNLLTIGDSNFGIFERDIEIAKYLKHVRDNTGYPRSVYVYFAKVQIVISFLCG